MTNTIYWTIGGRDVTDEALLHITHVWAMWITMATKVVVDIVQQLCPKDPQQEGYW